MRSKTQILLDEVEFLRAQVAQLQNYILMTGAAVPSTFPTMPSVTSMAKDWVPRGLHTTELEEDVEFQLQEGLIDEDTAAAILKAAADDDREYDFNE